MISQPCRLLFLAVALAVGFFNSAFAQDTVPVESSTGYTACGYRTLSAVIVGTAFSPDECFWLARNKSSSLPRYMRSFYSNVVSTSLTVETSGTSRNISGTIQGCYYQDKTSATPHCEVDGISEITIDPNLLFFSLETIEICPDSHPVNNGDGTCTREPDDQTCHDYAALHGSTGSDGQVKDLSVFGIFTPNKSGEVCKAFWDGLDPSHPDQLYCTYKLQGDGISLGGGEFSGRFVPSGGSCNPAPESSDPPLDEPETPEECEKRGFANCSADGLFLVSAEIVDGFCIPVCSATMPTQDPPEQSTVDSDNNGIPDVNDPNHPDYDPDDPHSDPDNDGTPNYQDPNHSSYIGGGASVGNTEGTNVLLQQILNTQVVNNDISATTNQLIAQQTQALGEKLDKLATGSGGGVGTGDGSLWTDESNTLDIETPECTPDPVTGRCAEFGSLGVQALPEKVVNLSTYADDFTPIDTAATCPASVSMSLFGGAFDFNTQPVCDVLSGIYYLVMFSAYYAVARIITRGAMS
jgi:hypothetical protein